MTQDLVVTAIGPDRHGIVADFTTHVHTAGANLADTRMVNLRGKFALLALVEGPPDVLEALQSTLRESADDLGLTFAFSSAPKGAAGEGMPFMVTSVSMDQRGIARSVTTFLQEQGINIEELRSYLESAPFSGAPLFRMEILVLVPNSLNESALRRALQDLGDTINCHIDLERIWTGLST